MSLGLSTSKELTTKSIDTKITDVEKWVAGDFALNSAIEDLADFESTDIEDDEEDVLVRTKATYTKALFRDLNYAKAGRKRLFELGIHNTFRELYQGQKITIDAGDRS